jgi:polysaccharide pyruvyl transferase WcaK-like protein
VDLYSVCYEPHDTNRRHALRAVPISSRFARAQLAARPKSRLNRLLTILFSRLPGELRDWFRAVRTLKGTALIVMTGTGMLTDYSTTAFGYPYDIFKWAIAARFARCRVRFVSIGVGPIHEPLSRVFIKAALRVADYRSYRDGLSKTRIEALGLEASRDPIFPDLAFSLPAPTLPAAAPSASTRLTVGLGVINYADHHLTTRDDRDVAYRLYLAKMCDFVTWLLERGYGLRVLQGDARHDAAVRRDLRLALGRRGIDYDARHIVDETSESVPELIRHIALTDIVISPRFHNLALALLMGKPVVSLSYDAKSDHLLQAFGLGQYTQPIGTFDVGVLIAHFTQLVDRREEHEPAIRSTAETFRDRLDGQYRLVFAGI